MAKKSPPKKKLPAGLNSKPVLIDVMMTVDVARSSVTDELYEYLVNSSAEYKDQVQKEHLINIGSALEDDACPKKFKAAVEVLDKIARDQVAAYIRFVSR